MSKIFGERIYTLLTEQGITQKELAGIIGVTEAAMSRYISGERDPKPETIANIATVLKTTSDYLLGIEDNNKSDEISYPHIKRLIARNVDDMSDSEKKELISVILNHMGNKKEM